MWSTICNAICGERWAFATRALQSVGAEFGPDLDIAFYHINMQ
jgi:hypothetical protein